MGKTLPRARVAPSSSKSSTTQNNSSPTRRNAPQTDAVLTPPVPPTYPVAPKPSQLSRDSVDKVNHYKKLCQYLNTNYGVYVPRKAHTYAFNVPRYTDRYHAYVPPNSDIVPRIGVDRLPEELATIPTKQVKRSINVKNNKRSLKKKSLDDLPEEDDVQKEDEPDEGEPAAKKAAAARDGDKPKNDDQNANNNDSIDEDDMEDADEELDVGTDYVSNYFDNGEDFLDSDREGDDDGPVY